ncbi:MAG TPA: NUDIX domain-containing protein [Bryobacteraceae bacterium]|nr:NUDIX domain-containing protein [Bryobacteraceae bacterium]
MIRAAGGLLWESTPERRRIAVIRRIRYDDWTLPKGKLKADESWEEAALREVEEETGYRASLNGFAGALAYQTSKGDKVVRFWHMVPVRMDQAAIDRSEVTDVIWLPTAEACVKLTYPIERALVEAWAQASHP